VRIPAHPSFARYRASCGDESHEQEPAMKTMARPSFFRVFDLLLGTTNPGLKLSSWTHDGIAWERERHSFTGPKHGQTIEIVTLTRPGKRGWSVMIVKEYWWVGKESRAVKSVRWAKPIDGQRSDIMNWFRAQEAALDHKLAIGGALPAPHSKGVEEIEIFDDGDDY
jgi:hypothetical protein